MNSLSPGTVCVDLDNVLAGTDQVMRRLIREVSGGRVDLRYEDVVCFDYWRCRDSQGRRLSQEEWHRVHIEFSRPENILQLQPLPGVQDCLVRLLASGFSLHFATSRLEPAHQATKEWLRRHAFPDHTLEFVQHGQKHQSQHLFVAAVEDDREQAYAFLLRSVPAFLIAHPWNIVGKSSSIVRVNDWLELTSILLRESVACPPEKLGPA